MSGEVTAKAPIPRSHQITKSNDLIVAAYRLTLNEQRLLLSAIAQLNPRKPLPRPIIVTAHDFSEQYGIPLKHAYEALKEATNSLYERDVKTNDKRYTSRFRWVDRVDYLDGGGETKLFFTIHVEPYLVHMNTRFTQYDLRRIAELNSVHSIRIFEMLQRFKNTGLYVVDVKEFRELLELGPSYERFNNLKSKVIDPALKELREKSGLRIELKTVRKGRTVVQLRFSFRDDDQIPLPLTECTENVDNSRNP